MNLSLSAKLRKNSKSNSNKPVSDDSHPPSRLGKRRMWIILVSALIAVSAFFTYTLQNHEAVAKSFVVSLMEKNFTEEAKNLSDKVECRISEDSSILDFRVPVRCTVPTVCNRDLNLYIFVFKGGFANHGPDPFSFKAARICENALRLEILEDLQDKIDRGG